MDRSQNSPATSLPASALDWAPTKVAMQARQHPCSTYDEQTDSDNFTLALSWCCEDTMRWQNRFKRENYTINQVLSPRYGNISNQSAGANYCPGAQSSYTVLSSK